MTSFDKDEYIDLLEERKNSSDLGFATRSWQCHPCQYSLNRNPQEIKQQVLTSVSVQKIVKQISDQNGLSVEEVERKASEILDEMSHNFQMRIIRLLSFILTKFFKQVYASIFVNKNGIKNISKISSHYPILYLPTHRSYADFLLTSYVCYHFNLPIPVIAAGLDFLGMKYIVYILRRCGAFFIRRSFVNDDLYWEIFSEYVKSHIQGCEFPLEFFIEGTRSRSAKSLTPKLGMLQVIIEEYFCSKIPDITIVPISISYDRTFEETLYAYELLGVPKPKESTTGLFKARKILSTNFNNAYVHFGNPISCKEYFNDCYRHVHNLSPHSSSVIIKEEQLLCQELAIYLIHKHQKNLLLPPFSLVCLVLGHPWFLERNGIKFDHLMEFFIWLEKLVRKSGASVYVGQMSSVEAATTSLKIHANIINISSDFCVSVKYLPDNKDELTSAALTSLRETTIKYGLPSMFVYHYGNQALQLIIHFCLVCLAINLKLQDHRALPNEVYHAYECLRKLLQKEFIFGKTSSKTDFNNTLQALEEDGLIEITDCTITLSESSYEKIEFLKQLPLYFLRTYYTICSTLLSMQWNPNETYTSRKLAKQCQSVIEKNLINQTLLDYKCLSLDVINNGIAFLVTERALYKEKNNGNICLMPHLMEIKNILEIIEPFLYVEQLKDSQISLYTAISSKL